MKALAREAVRKVIVYGTPHKPAGQDVARAIVTWLERAGVEVVPDVDGAVDIPRDAADADLVIAVGGDGTMLSAARALGPCRIPTLGVNLGRLGFLAEFTEPEVREWIAGRRALDLRVDPRMRLRCAVAAGDGAPVQHYALNDAAVQQGLPTRLLTLDLAVDGAHATKYRADGVVVATSVGSTAYSLALGGPILTPGLRAFVVTPIAPHALANRPVVISGDHTLRFTVENRVEEAALVLDGHVVLPLAQGASFEVARAEQDFLLVTSGDHSYYTLLRSKLGWGETPRWQREGDV